MIRIFQQNVLICIIQRRFYIKERILYSDRTTISSGSTRQSFHLSSTLTLNADLRHIFAAAAPDTAPVIIVQILRSLNTSWCRGPLVQLIILIIRAEFNLNLTPILDNYIAIQPNMKTITAIVMLISLEIIKY